VKKETENKKMKIELFYREPKSGSEYRGKELELLDHANRLLSDKSSLLDSQRGYETIELLGDEVIDLVKKLDTNKELDGIRSYIYW